MSRQLLCTLTFHLVFPLSQDSRCDAHPEKPYLQPPSSRPFSVRDFVVPLREYNHLSWDYSLFPFYNFTKFYCSPFLIP